MNLELTDIEIKKLRRLGTAIDNDLVPVKDLRSVITGLLRKVDQPTAAAPVVKRARLKEGRKDKYRFKLRAAI